MRRPTLRLPLAAVLLGWLLLGLAVPDGALADDAPRWHTFTVENGLAGNIVQAIWEDPQGAVWFGTENGVSRYDGEHWQTFRVEDGLIDNNVWAISGNAEGVWCATSSGVSVFSGGRWASWTVRDGLPSSDVRAILVARDGTVWAGTFGHGIGRWRSGSWERLDGLPEIHWDDDFVQAIWQSPSGAIWFSTTGAGLLRLDADDMEHFVFRQEGRNTVWGVDAARGGSGDGLWLATFSGILHIDDDDEVTPADQIVAGVALSESEVLAVAGGPGEVWFGTRTHGVFRRAAGGWERFTDHHGLARNYVQSLLVDSRGRVWFGTRGGGVTMLDRQPPPVEQLQPTVTAVTAEGGRRPLAEPPLFSDQENDLQFLFDLPERWTPPQDVRFLYWLERAGRAETPRWRSTQGSPGAAAHASSEPFIDLEPGSYTLHVVPVVGQARGVEQRYLFAIRSAPPAFSSETFRVAASGRELGYGLAVPPALFEATRAVELRFQGSDDKTSAGGLRYFYRIDGAGEWREAEASATVALDPGEHVIEAYARDGEGNVSETARVSAVVPSPLYTTVLFYLALFLVPSGLSGVLGAVGYQRWARRQALLRAVRGAFIPYDVGPLITVSDRYIGREHVVDALLGKIDNNSFYIYGEKRIGKTSLLHQIKQRLLQRNELDPRRRYLPIFRNIQELAPDQFWLYLARSITAEIGAVPTGLLADAPPAEGYDDLDAEEDIERAIAHVRAREGDRAVCVVLLLDEIDTLQRYPATIRQRFRAFCQHMQASVRVVVAGVLPPQAEPGETSPWYNIFERVALGPLRRDDALRLIRSYNHNPYPYDREAEQAVLAASDGKPFETQWLCSEAVKAMLAARRNRVSLADVERAVAVVVEERRAEYAAAWQSLPESLRAALRDTDGTLAPHPARDADYDRLAAAGLALRDADRYRLAALFQRWIGQMP